MPEQVLRPHQRPMPPVASLGVVAVVLVSALTQEMAGSGRANASSFDADADMAGGARAPQAGRPGLASATSPLTTLLPMLQASNRRRFAGQRVVLQGVRVQQVVGASILLVGPTVGDTLAVRTAGRVLGLAAGSIVRLEGTVRLVPGSLDGWTLDAVERHVLATRQVLLEADVLQPAAPRQAMVKARRSCQLHGLGPAHTGEPIRRSASGETGWSGGYLAGPATAAGGVAPGGPATARSGILADADWAWSWGVTEARFGP